MNSYVIGLRQILKFYIAVFLIGLDKAVYKHECRQRLKSVYSENRKLNNVKDE